MKKRCWNRETKVFNGHTKRLINFPPDYFLATDRGDVYIIKGHKNLIAFISLLLINRYCIQKIIFLKKVCLGVGFPSQVSSFKFTGKWKVRANKNYANLWLILLSPVQTDATVVGQQLPTLLDVTCCTTCCMLLGVVGQSLKLVKRLDLSKQTQHCWELLRPFARGFTSNQWF